MRQVVRKPMGKAPYTPSRWGEIFHALPHHEALGAGSAGPGKTSVLIAEPFTQIAIEHKRCYEAMDHEFPLAWGDSVGWSLHLRRTYIELGQTIARTKKMFPLIDPRVRWVEDSAEMRLGWIFSSGYHYQFGHCKDPDDWEMYQSSEFTLIKFDELVSFNEEQYDQISTRLRCSDPVLGDPELHLLKIRSMSNPFMRRTEENYTVHNPHWVRERFVDPDPKGNVTLERDLVNAEGETITVTSIYVPAKLSDNPDKAFVKQYDVQLLKQKPHIRRALRDGDWYVIAGAHYADDWRPTLHICKPFKIPGTWLRFRSMDWGFKKHGCIYWWAMDEEGNIWAEYEYSFRGRLAREVAKDVKRIETKVLGIKWKNGRSPLSGPADTQLWERRGDSASSKADEFAAEGVFWQPADKGPHSRQRNSELFTARLQDHEDETETPGIMFFEDCRMAQRTIPTIQSSDTDPECPADGGEDHWHDAICYACAYASHGRAGIGGAKSEDDADDDDYDQRSSRDADRREARNNGYG